MSHLKIARAASLTTSVLLTALPHGGQRTARRNAWASMSTDATVARARREADLAMDQAHARAAATTVHPTARAR